MGRRPKIPGALQLLMTARGHHTWSLEELHEELDGSGLKANFSSVFRSMARLEADGLVRRVELDDGRTHFELSTEHHDHLRCGTCGEVTAVPCGPVAQAIAQMEEVTGFSISDHRLVLTGTCVRCQRQPPATRNRSRLPALRGRLVGAGS